MEPTVYDLQEIYKFLEQNSDHVNENNWDYLYFRCRNLPTSTPLLSWVLFDAHIDPTPYFTTRTPKDYIFTLDVSKNPVFKLSDGVEIVGPGTFQRTKGIKEIYLPKTIEHIGFAAFYEIPNVTIYYDGTEEKFRKINIMGNESFDKLFVESTGKIVFSDGTIPLEDFR